MREERSWNWDEPGVLRGVVGSVLLAALCLTAGVGWASDIHIHGQITSTLRPDSEGVALNQSNRGETTFDLLDVDLFFDAAPSSELQVRTWLVLNDSYSGAVSLAAAYMIYEAVDRGRLYLEAGKIPVPLGNYLDRFSADRGPLIGIPLAWQWHSSLARDVIPSGPEELLDAAGTGQTGPPEYASATSSRRGMAMLYAACYDLGIVALGSGGSIEYRAGMIAGTPGSPASGSDNNESRTLAGRLGWSPGPALRTGLSGAWGAYLPSEVADVLPFGREVGDYKQALALVDLELSGGHWVLYSEAAWAEVESPHVKDDLRQTSYYVEVHRRLAPGWTVGARWDQIRFGRIGDGRGGKSHWSTPHRRLELGSVYDLSRDFSVRSGLQLNHSGVGAFDPDANVVALQLIARF